MFGLKHWFSWRIFETLQMINHRRHMLDAIEINAKLNNSFATKAISTENVEGKKSSLKKGVRSKTKELSQIFFVFKVPWVTSL